MDILDELTNSYEKYICEKADQMRIPLAGTFELTPLCNMNCEMCYIVQRKREVLQKGGLLDVDQWMSIASQAVERGMLYLLITGGEPFLYPNFKKLYEKLSSLGIYIVINTNGTLLDEETILWLAERPPRRLNISLYGSSAETYGRLCKHAENFEKVMKSLELLKKYNILVRLRTVLTPENVQDYDSVVEIANRLEMPLGMAYYMFPSVRKGRNIAENTCRFSPEEAGKIKFRYIRDSYSEQMFDELVENVIKNLEDAEKYEYYGYDHPSCRGGLSSFWVSWQGEMVPCGMMKSPTINLLTDSFDRAWEKLVKETSELILSHECAVCKKRRYCNVCMSALYTETGTFNEKPQYLCKMTDTYVELLKEEYFKKHYVKI